MMSREVNLPVGSLGVVRFGRKLTIIKVIKDNRKELHPVPLYEDSDEEEDVDLEDTDEEWASDEELYMYAQNQDRYSSSVTARPTIAKRDYKQLCYYVLTVPGELRRWVPAAAVRAAGGSQPCRPGFVAEPTKVSYYTQPPGSATWQLKTFEMDPLLPFKATPVSCSKLLNKRNTTETPSSFFFDNAKKLMYENYYKALENDCRLLNSRAALDALLYDVRDKHDLVVVDVVSEADIDNYLDLWKRSSTCKPAEGAACAACAACGRGAGRARACPRCAARCHLACRKRWLLQIIRGTSPPRESPQAGAGSAPPRELRDVLPCAACVWEHSPSEKRWYMRVWPTTCSDPQLDAPVN